MRVSKWFGVGLLALTLGGCYGETYGREYPTGYPYRSRSVSVRVVPPQPVYVAPQPYRPAWTVDRYGRQVWYDSLGRPHYL